MMGKEKTEKRGRRRLVSEMPIGSSGALMLLHLAFSI